MIKKLKLSFVLLTISILSSIACKEETPSKKQETAVLSETKLEPKVPKQELSKAFKDYWYNGEAEITSYKLEQARYGEIKDGTSVLIFVTEDFMPEQQVKANNYSTDNIPVLKLNMTKNFNTGIYPYSIMQSTFFPVANNQHALKISASVQEWCGHVYTQLNNRDKFEVMSHSYFQGEADDAFSLEKNWTENELWTKLRINPKSLPVGDIKVIPSIESARLNHDELKAYNTSAKLDDNSYTLSYHNLSRTLQIEFNSTFPYEILGWTETTTTGHGPSEKTLTTKATKLESLKTDYWNKKSNADLSLRTDLKLQ
ncbi:septum formation inhibitor Maf [Winogradskyella endarachnes]|uniref:Septum formation inhibitor Maf n=1 Tax=Winogradskyella endarachnes TaxID=2681965 RepID=A0A6L6U7Y8_9FLAO|nr:septum formation inhibitor Maf [Winogradskyella endarachnes]MUU78383.1 septum formation inhibitor Maf [Winogradskyella endarachnes]